MRRTLWLLTLVACGCRLDASGVGASSDDAAVEDTLVAETTRPPEDATDSVDAVDDAAVDTALVDVAIDAPPAVWTEKDWSYRRRLAVKASLLTADLSGFVVPVVLSDVDMIGKVAIDGRDLHFTAPDGTPLSFELVRWDSAGGNLFAWVKLPKIGPALPNDFYLYYGNSAATASEDPAKTWSGEDAVWHLDETTANGGTTVKLVDATGTGHDGTQNGSESTTGLLLGAQKLDAKDAIEIAKPAEIVLGDTDCTFVAWFRTTEGRQQGILIKAKGEGHEAADKLIGTGHDGPFFGVDHGWVGFARTNVDIKDGKWHHIAWVQSKDVKDKLDGWRLYLDGVERGAAQYETRPDVAGHTVRIGAKASGSYFDNPWSGDLDEIRYARASRGPAWIAALERSQRSPGTFLEMGAEEKAE